MHWKRKRRAAVSISLDIWAVRDSSSLLAEEGKTWWDGSKRKKKRVQTRDLNVGPAFRGIYHFLLMEDDVWWRIPPERPCSHIKPSEMIIFEWGWRDKTEPVVGAPSSPRTNKANPLRYFYVFTWKPFVVTLEIVRLKVPTGIGSLIKEQKLMLEILKRP